jgi:hypothetical protein
MAAYGSVQTSVLHQRWYSSLEKEKILLSLRKTEFGLNGSLYVICNILNI